MHMALLLGYGAAAVNPYLALDTVGRLDAHGELGATADSGDEGEARRRYANALSQGVLKVCSRMGISTVQSYRGAQIFEAIGLGPRIVERYFPGTVSRVGGLELRDLQGVVARRHAVAFDLPDPESGAHVADPGSGIDSSAPRLHHAGLEPGGEYQLRRRGEHHAWNAEAIVDLQRAARTNDGATFRRFSEALEGPGARLTSLRSLFRLEKAESPLKVSQVESAASIVRRFATGAMSLGSLSPEAHETLAIAVNRIGARSNTGEGGEDPTRSIPDVHGDSRRSAIKQVASGRFGVTAAYLVDADQLQIKIAQGAKPGEGGQIPGHKVDENIARLRNATPGVGLISPPPHHDIYSIEDLAQLIHDLRCVNPSAEISVKLVSEAGVGTVAAGVAKARADHIVIAGHDGGTGASPMSSLKYVGLPWEIGLAETHQVLVRNGLRDRVRLQVDGGLRTGRDVVVAALLGADEFAFGTAPLVAMGCVMMRVCHLNTCPVGIATQDPELRNRFAGTPDDVVHYFALVAEQARRLLARLGVASFDELVGRTQLLALADIQRWPWLRDLDLSPLLAREDFAVPGTGVLAAGPAVSSRRRQHDNAHRLGPKLVEADIIAAAEPALAGAHPVTITRRVETTDLALGAMLAGEVVRRAGPTGLPEGSISLRLTGTGGQSFGAFAVAGMTLDLVGVTNDYAGKGLSGGRIVVHPPAVVRYAAEENVVTGNVALYGATSGEAYFRGRAGERFCVRNSGATAVVEGVGDHGCEYMTGGMTLILGPTGRNFGAGMSGGIAYVLDQDGKFASRCNHEMIGIEPLSSRDAQRVHTLMVRHAELTGSAVARQILGEWPAAAARFRAVVPNDVRAARAALGPHHEPYLEPAIATDTGFAPPAGD
jgi:glutamate synthase domain-containing protein 2/glutamate synthase domain-containing protein 3